MARGRNHLTSPNHPISSPLQRSISARTSGITPRKRPSDEARCGREHRSRTDRRGTAFTSPEPGDRRVPEPKDYLRVLINGKVVWQRSGREQHGTAEITLPVGNSTVTFVYQKDALDDGGLDIATIDNLRLRANGRPLPVASFDGMKPGDLPIGWYSSSQPWQIRAKASHVSRLDAEASTTAPVVDGTANAGEYNNQATGMSLARYIDQGSAPPADPTKPAKDDSGKLILQARRPEEALYLVLKLKPMTTELGSERALVTLYFDALRNDTLAQLGCSGVTTLPRNEDRKIELSYSLSSGQATGTVSVAQYKGNCTAGSPWTQITDLTRWSVTAVVAEQQSDDTLTLEARIRLKPSTITFGTGEVFTSNVFGLGIEFWAPSSPFRFPPPTNPWTVHFPYAGGGAPRSDDVSSWETVRMGYAGPADAPLDACCSPGITL